MRVIEEINVYDFVERCWSGAKDTVDDLSYEEVEMVMDMYEDMSDGEPISLTDLNDFFWFERDLIAEWLGYDSYDELMHRESEDD